MTRPAAVDTVAASSPATSSWANAVADAINTIAEDIYASSALDIAWSALTGVPATFAPSAHAASHANAGSDPVAAAWGRLTGVPSTFAPTAHGDTHRTGHGDAVQLDWAQVDGKPSTFAPSGHHTSHETGGSDAVTPIVHAARHAYGGADWVDPAAIAAMYSMISAGGGAAGSRVWVGTTDPAGGAVEGDIWVKG
jgi:hypothetical protein